MEGDYDTVLQSRPSYTHVYRLKQGVDPSALDFGELGYAREALASWALFSRFVEEGKIPATTRFQVSLPTPVALLSGFVAMDSRALCAPALERAIIENLERIQDRIPNHRLAIQWDVCYEVVGTDGGPSLHYADHVDGSAARIGRLAGHVRSDVEMGMHLCYGDPGHQHIVNPDNLETSVAIANAICAASPRTVDFMHIPVPRDRSDDAYFEALEQLNMPAQTRLILGLIHYSDGVAGTRQRMATADRFVADYDVATECGFGRRDPSTIAELLQIHREICS
ncbi:MAG: hypothetical protein P8Q36_05725 [Alphaproteobacteria bacterium]|nr:hypothetical protein [Rhodospirillaceae bacterium]MBT6509131.1 hypothetical protein [Rhodospirillaceae bacterium]MBT7614735.1 hypothetical protein [Rhodospirillaceae bacterium]MDG2480356.1 hypothetical protein [Alphaproteobacteria bacterium]